MKGRPNYKLTERTKPPIRISRMENLRYLNALAEEAGDVEFAGQCEWLIGRLLELGANQ
jgi:hypothetical protein